MAQNFTKLFLLCLLSTCVKCRNIPSINLARHERNMELVDDRTYGTQRLDGGSSNSIIRSHEEYSNDSNDEQGNLLGLSKTSLTDKKKDLNTASAETESDKYILETNDTAINSKDDNGTQDNILPKEYISITQALSNKSQNILTSDKPFNFKENIVSNNVEPSAKNEQTKKDYFEKNKVTSKLSSKIINSTIAPSPDAGENKEMQPGSSSVIDKHSEQKAVSGTNVSSETHTAHETTLSASNVGKDLIDAKTTNNNAYATEGLQHDKETDKLSDNSAYKGKTNNKEQTNESDKKEQIIAEVDTGIDNHNKQKNKTNNDNNDQQQFKEQNKKPVIEDQQQITENSKDLSKSGEPYLDEKGVAELPISVEDTKFTTNDGKQEDDDSVDYPQNADLNKKDQYSERK